MKAMKAYAAGDLLRFKKSKNYKSTAGRMDAVRNLVLVLETVGGSKNHFYGISCHNGAKHLWTWDLFELASDIGCEKK